MFVRVLILIATPISFYFCCNLTCWNSYFDPQSSESVVIYISFFMFAGSGRPKRLLIFVNPYGGKKSASKIFVDDVKPLLDDANVEYTLQGVHSVRQCSSSFFW